MSKGHRFNLTFISFQNRKCEDILNEISIVCDRDSRTLMKSSFSIAYPFIYLKYSPETACKCVEYMQKIFGSDVLATTVFDSEVLLKPFS